MRQDPDEHGQELGRNLQKKDLKLGTVEWTRLVVLNHKENNK